MLSRCGKSSGLISSMIVMVRNGLTVNMMLVEIWVCEVSVKAVLHMSNSNFLVCRRRHRPEAQEILTHSGFGAHLRYFFSV